MKNNENLKRFRELPCIACGVEFGIVVHHIKTRGSGGTDHPFNLMPLCIRHHSEIHTIGTRKFSEKFTRVDTYLYSIGWHFNGFKWISPI